MKSGRLLRGLMLLPYQLYVIVGFLLLMVFWGVASCLASLFDAGGNRPHRCLTYWAKSNLAMAGLRVQVEGVERLDPQAAYIFMPNHASFLDILLAFACIPHNFRIVTKEEMFFIPVMGWALKRSRQLPMDRTHPRRGLARLRQASALLKEGISIVVFPEGTRTANGEIGDFKATLFILPIRAAIPVVPLRVAGTFEALKRGSILLNPVPLKLTFYDPIPPGSYNDRDRWIYAKKVREVLLSSP